MTVRGIIASAIAACLLTSSIAVRAQADSDHEQAVDRLVNSFGSNHHIPGLSVAVIDRGRVLLARGYGLSDLENAVPATADTVYRIASVSKSITATAAMKLVEGGKLDLDAPIQKYCPDFPQKPWPITTRELLSHQSGIRDYKDIRESFNTRHYTSIKEALGQFAGDALDFEPGTKMQYTSYGYIVLGCVMEGASGVSYDRYMRQAIFDPAQMAATRLDDVFAILPHRARGYKLLPSGEVQNAAFVDVSNKPPGSGINSTARDMGAFVVALYSSRLVSKATFGRMVTPSTIRDGKPTIYGMGFFLGGPISKHDGMREAGHGGDQQGYSSLLYLLPEREFGVVVLSNLEAPDTSRDFIDLARQIYDIVSVH
jgi:CubicO group peptidase (beta-lactamase class C family)